MMIPGLRKLFVRGLSTPDDVQELAGIACLGSIPDVQPEGAPVEKPAALGVEAPASAFAAALKEVHAALLEAAPDIKVVALTSAVPRDGKTTCSVALARQSALAGYRTVLVDCDLRRRSSTAEFEVAPTVGLLEVVNGACSLEEALYTDHLTTLRFLPILRDPDAIRTATVQDVFGSAQMARLFDALRQRFDYVYVDAPPVVIADTRRVAKLVDAYVFLTRWRRTPKSAVTLALKMLKTTGVPLAGMILTRAPPAAGVASPAPSRSFRPPS